jgi:DNA-binding NarL/FixJ family response regulator
LVPLVPAAPESAHLEAALRRSLVVDLFQPPQREAYRCRVMALTANGLSQDEIASKLNLTETAVQRAVALNRAMEKLGISDPYLPLTAPPDDYTRLRRHKHPRYRFEPMNGPMEDKSPA